MKKIFVLLIVLMAWSFDGLSFAASPAKIAGFKLGGNISAVKDLVKMDTGMALRYREYLTEYLIEPQEGFKSGYLVVGNCEEPGRIVSIKLKYENSKRSFYDELLDRFKDRFGEPSEWKGDPFQTFIAWKWSFTDADKTNISMILQHYSGDDEEQTRGNSLKITSTSLIEKERLCNEQKERRAEAEEKAKGSKKAAESGKSIDFNRFVPE